MKEKQREKEESKMYEAQDKREAEARRKEGSKRAREM